MPFTWSIRKCRPDGVMMPSRSCSGVVSAVSLIGEPAPSALRTVLSNRDGWP